MPKKILFVTTGMQTGGAERQLVLLATGMMERGHAVTIFSLSKISDIGSAIGSGSVPILTFSLRKSPLFIIDLIAIFFAARKLKPDIIQGWMYIGNIVASFLAMLLRKPHLHSLRASNMDTNRYWTQIKLNAFLSPFPKKIISNSLAGESFHKKFGFNGKNLTTVENAIDTNYFKPNAKSAKSVRRSLQIPQEKKVILYAARIDPMKAHDVVVGLAIALPNIYFIFSGKGTNEIALPSNAIGLGIVSDMPSLYNAAEGLVNFSYFGEGFPNVICEDLECGTPVIANDIGDTRRILGDEFTVDNLEIQKLTRKITSILVDKELDKKCSTLRRKIAFTYNIENMLNGFETFYVHDKQKVDFSSVS